LIQDTALVGDAQVEHKTILLLFSIFNTLSTIGHILAPMDFLRPRRIDPHIGIMVKTPKPT
jgi:hypothetical protein